MNYELLNYTGFSGTVNSDINMLYWCEEETNVDFDYVEGKCYVTLVDEIDMDIQEYTRGGPHRFYFREVSDNNDNFPLDSGKKKR